MSNETLQIGSIKRSITLPVELNKFVEKKAKKIAKERGNHVPNFSAALSDIIIEARKLETQPA
jgi:hypothetical protein